MSRLKQWSGIATVILSLASAIAPAQTTMSLHIEVSDPSGAVVPGAFIGISDAVTNAVVNHAAADSQGKFTIVLPAKPYHLSVDSPGFKPDEREIDGKATTDEIRIVLQIIQCASCLVLSPAWIPDYSALVERPEIKVFIDSVEPIRIQLPAMHKHHHWL